MILQRIKDLINAKGFNVNSFAHEIGIAQTTLSTYFKKDRFPAYETLHSILAAFPDVSAEWLMRGEGSMYITDDLPIFRGDETEDEENVHVALARCRGELKLAEEENIRLLGQLEFMEEYNLKVAGMYNKAKEELEKIQGKKVSGKKDII